MEVEYEGDSYLVPDKEPPQQRGLSLCHPIFDDAIGRYCKFAQRHLAELYGSVPATAEYASRPRFEIYAGETRRSLERQVWLYSRGRVPNSGTAIRSNTLDSRHRWGLAVDLYAVDHQTKETIWDDAWWAALYEAMPPLLFGLKDIRPFEFVHLELAEADLMIARASEFKLFQS